MATKNLKVLLSGDTKPYRQEVDKAAVATKSFKNDIGSQLSELAEIFGVQTESIGEALDKVKVAFGGMQKSMQTAIAGGAAYQTQQQVIAASTNAVSLAQVRLTEAQLSLATAQQATGVTAETLAVREAEVVAASTALSAAQARLATAQTAATAATGLGTVAMNIFKIALIGTGIGALIVALGSLIAYFTQTERGAEFVERAMAGIKAAFKVLIDRAAQFGEGLFKIISGDFSGGWTALKGSLSGVGAEMYRDAKAAKEFALQTQELEDKERALILVNAEKKKQIAEMRLEAKQEETAAARKRELLLGAMALEKQVLNSEKAIIQEKSDIYAKQIALGEFTDEQTTKSLELKAEVIAKDQEAAETLRGYQRELKAVNGELQAQADAVLKLNIEKRKEAAGYGLKKETAKGPEPFKVPGSDLEVGKLTSIANQAKMVAEDMSTGISGSMLDMSEAVKSTLSETAVGFGEFIGNLMSGQSGMDSFGAMITKSLGGLMVTVGKQMIGLAVAGIALKKLMKNPWLALAAGIALVALGTVASNAVQNTVNNGGGASGSSSVGSNTPSFNYDTRGSSSSMGQSVNVTIGGEFKLKGSTLVAAISNETDRKAIG